MDHTQHTGAEPSAMHTTAYRHPKSRHPLPDSWHAAFPAMPRDMTWPMLAFDVIAPLAFLWMFLGGTALPWNPLLGELDGPLPRIVWSMLLIMPCLMRRLAPDEAAWSFAVIAALQLAFGPPLLGVDVLAAPMLFTAIVYGSRSKTRDFITVAVVMACVATVFYGYGTTATNMVVTAQLSGEQVPVPSPALVWMHERSSFLSACMEWGVFIGACITAAATMGLWRRTTRESVMLLREHNQILERTQHEAQHEAAIRERARIARDMHDVVAHTLSTIIVQADAGRYAGAQDLALARRTMETIQRETTHAQHDMDQLLGVLDVPGGSQQRQDVGYDRIPQLISQACLEPNTLAVTHAVQGNPNPSRLSTNGSICAFRVVQEALTNARKYAAGPLVTPQPSPMQSGNTINPANSTDPAPTNSANSTRPTSLAIPTGSSSTDAPAPMHVPVHVLVEESWDALPGSHPGDGDTTDTVGLHLTIIDDGVGADSGLDGHKPGFGLMGMRERVNAAGGSLSAGPRSALEQPDTAGFRVEAFIPYETPGPRHSEPDDTADYATGSARALSEPTDTAGINASTSADATGDAGVCETGLRTASARAAGKAIRRKRHKPSIIERAARWTMHHTLAVDTLETIPVILIKLAAITSSVETTWSSDGSTHIRIRLWGMPSSLSVTALAIILAILPCLPLCVRRTKPDLSCMLVFAACMLELTFISGEPLVDILPVSLALYSGALYGTATRTKRLVACSAIGSLWLGVNLWVASIAETADGIETIHTPVSPFGLLTGAPIALASDDVWRGQALVCLICVIVSFLACLTFIFAGSHERGNADNYMLLKARQEALTREREAQEQAAAAEERTRISASIQQEVSGTLAHIAVMAREGRAGFDSNPTPQQISESFHAIASEGRRALRRMRELLGVLRGTSGQTEQMAEAADTATLPQRELRPAAPLPEQLHESGLDQSNQDQSHQ
ncbi:signal transduction histidine kinase [Pseudoscardovia suis]|uniref:histidine kinase n=2 Tax=Pseudoscardovia suis TaxID=987063 RepID=A0A261EYN5_9BIFI|nr:sensor histidine kinase [Pseudoscardovia suis]PJJ69424.1 signal transduction histidine kinase [Pseudoscardovia suis]